MPLSTCINVPKMNRLAAWEHTEILVDGRTDGRTDEQTSDAGHCMTAIAHRALCAQVG